MSVGRRGRSEGSEGVWVGEVVMWGVRMSGKGGGNVGSEGVWEGEVGVRVSGKER